MIRTIAVDLTPVLPGGHNGGAKVFVLELLRHLAEAQKQVQFILLTQADSHEELAILDRPNMRRLKVLGSTTSDSLRLRSMLLASRILQYLPGRMHRMLGRLGHQLNMRWKRGRTMGFLHDMGVDLLFCPFTAPTYFEVGIPTVCTIYDLQYKTFPEFFSAGDVANRERTFEQACQKATMLAAISDYSRDSAILHGHLDPSSTRTIYLRMAHRITAEAEDDGRALEELDLTAQRYLVYPANFWKHKNHEMLFTAFGMACHNGLPEDIKLVCTGAPGERQAWLTSAAQAMDLGDRIVFPGYLPSEVLATVISKARGMVFPSLYEGFGLPVIEAMATEIPVACSNTTSLPEVAGDAAIFFDPRIPSQVAQAMVSLVEDGALRARLVKAGRARASEFSDSELMAREYWDVFEAAMASDEEEDLLTGAYADSWLGNRLDIRLASAQNEQHLEIGLLAPAWLPHRHLALHVRIDGKRRQCLGTLDRGAMEVMTMPIASAGGHYQIEIGPTFVPSRLGMGDDSRELSVILQRCRIVRPNGQDCELFPGREGP